MKSEMKFIKRLMVMVAIGLLFVAYGHWLTKTVREDTIKSATLVESNECGRIDSVFTNSLGQPMTIRNEQ